MYKYLRVNSELNKKGKVGSIPWNFTKFLVNKEGKVVQMYEPVCSLFKMVDDIELMLREE